MRDSKLVGSNNFYKNEYGERQVIEATKYFLSFLLLS